MGIKKILFDTETTGIEEEDRIIQIGAMIIDKAGHIDVFNEFCKPPVEIKLEAMETHNITPDMIEGKSRYRNLSFRKRLNELNTEKNYLIAHNINFDLKMIEKEGFKNNMRMIDTLRIARHYYKEVKHHRLQHLRYALGLYKLEKDFAESNGIIIKAHDAIGDVLIMKLLLDNLEERTKELYPNQDPYEQMAYLTNIPVLIPVFKFGKYKDLSIEDVCLSDKGYINWMRNNMDLDEDMDYTLRYYLGELSENECKR